MMRRTGTPCSSIRSRITRVWNAVPSMAANSSSCAVWVSRQPSVTPLSSGLTSTVRSPLSHVMRSSPVWPGARSAPSPSASCATVVPARLRDRIEDIAGRRESRFDAGLAGVDRAGHNAAHAGDQRRLVGDRHDAGGRADHVDHVADAAARADGVPVRVEGAGRERECRRAARAARPTPARACPRPVAGGIHAAELRADAGEQRIDGGQEFLRREAAELLVPHPFVAHRADAARDGRGVGDAAQDGRRHVAVFERGRHAVALAGIVAQPVQQLRPAPFRRVDAAAPLDGVEVRRGGRSR